MKNIVIISYVTRLLYTILYFISFNRFGSAEVTISDQGREFVNAVTKYLFDMTGAEHHISSAYHPKTNHCRTIRMLAIRSYKPVGSSWAGILADVRALWMMEFTEACLFSHQ